MNNDKVKRYSENLLDYLNFNINSQSTVIYMAGSLCEGFGNEKSDIDVYVLTNRQFIDDIEAGLNSNDVFSINDTNLAHNFIIENQRFDVEFWELEKVMEGIGQFNAIDFHSERHMGKINDGIFDMLHRMKYAIPVYNKEDFESIFQKLDQRKFKYYQAIKKTEQYDSWLEDLEGAYRSYDYGTMFFLSRHLIDNAVVAFLAINGETNPNIKWLYRKLARFSESTKNNIIEQRYIYLQNRNYQPDQIDQQIRETLDFTQKININTQQLILTMQKEGVQ
ncbi:hypothetical protein [Paenibacillus sp. NPDC058177]|uniref:hypothetical protein n=1 Tax=Paenibacillus sp. NPDC058177 TaxID=3346369 RepID=UPI0036DA1405